MHNQLEPEDQSHDQLAAELLNDYLEHVTAPLVDVASYQEREAVRMELRQHIEALAEAHEELGSDRAEAMRSAIAQFGKADRVGNGIARQMIRSTVRKFVHAYGQRVVTACLAGALGALLSRLADLSMVNSGIVRYDSGWFIVFLGFAMGVVTDQLISVKGRRSFVRDVLRGPLVFTGTFGAIILVIAVLSGAAGYPWLLAAAGISRMALAGAVSGIFSALLARVWRPKVAAIPGPYGLG